MPLPILHLSADGPGFAVSYPTDGCRLTVRLPAPFSAIKMGMLTDQRGEIRTDKEGETPPRKQIAQADFLSSFIH